MKRFLWLALALAMILSGCSWMDGNYASVTPHQDHSRGSESSDISASTYIGLLDAFQDLIADGKEKGIIYVGEFAPNWLEYYLKLAVDYTMKRTPLGAYAVEDIQYELGSNGGKPAVALKITYLHSRMEILQVKEAANMTRARELIRAALANCDASIVVLVNHYEPMDISQLVEDYAANNPQIVMEVPQVSTGVYPDSGPARILELQFSYQNSRESLRQMRTQVEAIFDSAALYVSATDTDHVKFSQLYSFLKMGIVTEMERFDYKPETSLTPAYSLLRHGVGDSSAFAEVYAAMCRQAGLECHTVTGTCNGEPRSWNIVLEDGNYFHVDLLRCIALGGYQGFTDNEMEGYVWDYSAYPACPETVTPPPEEDPADPTEPTEPIPPTEPSEEPTEPSLEPTESTEENTEN